MERLEHGLGERASFMQVAIYWIYVHMLTGANNQLIQGSSLHCKETISTTIVRCNMYRADARIVWLFIEYSADARENWMLAAAETSHEDHQEYALAMKAHLPNASEKKR
jgi:hypothetical protein